MLLWVDLHYFFAIVSTCTYTKPSSKVGNRSSPATQHRLQNPKCPPGVAKRATGFGMFFWALYLLNGLFYLGNSFHIFCTWQNVFLRKTWEVKLVKLTLIIWGHDHVHLETLVDKKCRDAKKGRDKDFQVGAGRALELSDPGLLFPSLSSKLIAPPSTK